MKPIWQKITAGLLFALMLGAAGCGNQTNEAEKTPASGEQAQQPAATASLTMKPEAYPRVDGSTVTIPLSEAVASAVLHLPLEEARQYVLHNKTHQAYLNLVDGTADIIFVTSPSQEEWAYAAEKGVELVVTPVVSEGFVFLVNKDNPVDTLTLAQIRDIYAGRITNWQEVGGNDQAIMAFQRPENSGSQTGMLDLVLGADEIMAAPTEKIVAEMGELIDAVASYDNAKNAIGYSYYYYATDMWLNDEVKLLAVDGVAPDKTTISDGTYPITTAYYAVTRSDLRPDDSAQVLLDWMLSSEGQQVAEEAGYVKLGQ